MKEEFTGNIISIEYSRQAFKIKRKDVETPIRLYADDCMFNRILSFIGKENLHSQKALTKFEVQGRVLTKFDSTAKSENKTASLLDFCRMLTSAIRWTEGGAE